MGIIEEILKNKEELLLKFLQILEGKEATTRLNLKDIKLDVGNSRIKVNGDLEVTFVPVLKKKK